MPELRNIQKAPVPLSDSVAVGVPPNLFKQSHSIQVKFELEESFRPRYKSDYFGMNGKTRKPRYVADRKGNHFITLNVSLLHMKKNSGDFS